MAQRNSLKEVAVPLIVGGAVLTAAEALRRAFRHAQLFCPSVDPVKSWDPADYGIPGDAVEEVEFETPDGELLYGWYCRAENPIASGLFCHGNTGNLTVSAEVIPSLLQAGFNVLFFDYRGFGRSTGIPTINGVVSDGVTAARFHNRIRPAHLPSILYGFSLGGAVAGQVIKHHPFDGLILQSTFTSLPAITRAVFPRLPLHLVAGDLFDTLEVVKRLTVPLLVIHGSADEVIPCWMAHDLYDSCSAPKQIEIVDGAMHKDCYVHGAAALIEAMHHFALSLRHDTRHIPLEPLDDPQIADAVFRAVRRMLRRKRQPTGAAAS